MPAYKNKENGSWYQNTLSEQVFKYIMTTNDDGEVVRIIQSKTHYPFFSFYIQEREKTNIKNPSTEEEQCIKETYEYLYNSWFYNKCWGQAHRLTPTIDIEPQITGRLLPWHGTVLGTVLSFPLRRLSKPAGHRSEVR